MEVKAQMICVKGDFLKKFKAGQLTLEDLKFFQENPDLLMFAWENQRILEADPSIFINKTEVMLDSKPFEKKYKCKMIQSKIQDNQQFNLCLSIYREEQELALYVWNCRAYLQVDEKIFLSKEKILCEITGSLVDQIIEQENKGSITTSGIYYPHSQESYNGLKEKLKEIERNGS